MDLTSGGGIHIKKKKETEENMWIFGNRVKFGSSTDIDEVTLMLGTTFKLSELLPLLRVG